MRLVCPAIGDAALASLAEVSGMDSVVADGPIAFLLGGSMCAGSATGAKGWRLVRPDGLGNVVGRHYPATDDGLQPPAWHDGRARAGHADDRLASA
ncbi:hypothetical protein [Micromonospora fulviviridis]|uniref:Uncharacterized protein n=1 Tax=Micromonospora fulviviridis TaxID=47860 RepID=A0ABV2VP15_9ACTN